MLPYLNRLLDSTMFYALLSSMDNYWQQSQKVMVKPVGNSDGYSLPIKMCVLATRSLHLQRLTCISWVTSYCQPVVVTHIGDSERIVDGIPSNVVEFCEIYAEFVLALSGQTVQVVVTEPKLSLQIPKAPAVVSKVQIEIYTAVLAPLENLSREHGGFKTPDFFNFIKLLLIYKLLEMGTLFVFTSAWPYRPSTIVCLHITVYSESFTGA